MSALLAIRFSLRQQQSSEFLRSSRVALSSESRSRYQLRGGGGLLRKLLDSTSIAEFSRKSSRASCVPSPGPRRRVKAVPEARYLAGSFSHSPWRDDVGRVIKERPGRERERGERGITHASDKASCRRHRSQRSRLLYLYCPQTLLSAPPLSPFPCRCRLLR